MRSVLNGLIFLLIGYAMPANARPLDPFQWDYRPLLIFTPSADYTAFKVQFTATNAALNALYDRDILRIHIIGRDDSVGLHGQPMPHVPTDDVPTAHALRSTYQVLRDQFTVILIGKDGGEKGRWTEPVAMDDILALIDTMPMRIREKGYQ